MSGCEMEHHRRKRENSVSMTSCLGLGQNFQFSIEIFSTYYQNDRYFSINACLSYVFWPVSRADAIIIGKRATVTLSAPVPIPDVSNKTWMQRSHKIESIPPCFWWQSRESNKKRSTLHSLKASRDRQSHILYTMDFLDENPHLIHLAYPSITALHDYQDNSCAKDGNHEESNGYDIPEFPFSRTVALSLAECTVIFCIAWILFQMFAMKQSSSAEGEHRPERPRTTSGERKHPADTTRHSEMDMRAHDLLRHLMIQHKHCKTSGSLLLRMIQNVIALRPCVLQTQDSNRLFPLHLACLYSSHWSVIDCLVQNDPANSLQKTATTGNGFEILPLHFAAWRNHSAKAIQILIKAFPEALSMHTERGRWLPLHLACRSGSQCSLELVQELVEQNPWALQSGGSASELPLHCACYYQNSFDVIEYLTQQNPSALTAKTREGWTPLTLAAARNLSLETIYFLVRQCPPVLLQQTYRQYQSNPDQQPKISVHGSPNNEIIHRESLVVGSGANCL